MPLGSGWQLQAWQEDRVRAFWTSMCPCVHFHLGQKLHCLLTDCHTRQDKGRTSMKTLNDIRGYQVILYECLFSWLNIIPDTLIICHYLLWVLELTKRTATITTKPNNMQQGHTLSSCRIRCGTRNTNWEGQHGPFSTSWVQAWCRDGFQHPTFNALDHRVSLSLASNSRATKSQFSKWLNNATCEQKQRPQDSSF